MAWVEMPRSRCGEWASDSTWKNVGCPEDGWASEFSCIQLDSVGCNCMWGGADAWAWAVQTLCVCKCCKQEDDPHPHDRLSLVWSMTTIDGGVVWDVADGDQRASRQGSPHE